MLEAIDESATWLDWCGGGYSAVPRVSENPRQLMASEVPYERWLAAFSLACAGEMDVVEEISSDVEEEFVTALVADAGSNKTIDRITGGLIDTTDFEVAEMACHLLRVRAKLRDARFVLDMVVRFRDVKDADILAIWLSGMLESRSGVLSDVADYVSIDDYTKAATARIEERGEKFGTDDVLLFRGERYGVVRHAEWLLRDLREPRFFDPEMRRRFEAATGVDCREFYRDGMLEPRAAEGIVEAFLESHASERFEDGKRYFFGHEIS